MNYSELVFKKYRKTALVEAVQMTEDFTVETLEGVMQGKAGDYLCRGVAGEYWPIKKEIFEQTYIITAFPADTIVNNVDNLPVTIDFK